MSNRTKKVLIALPETLHGYVDLMARLECRTRAELIREALRRYYDNFRRTYPTGTNVELLEKAFDRSES